MRFSQSYDRKYEDIYRLIYMQFECKKLCRFEMQKKNPDNNTSVLIHLYA